MRTQARLIHQAGHAVLATQLSHIVHVTGDFTVAANTATVFPTLSCERADALILHRTRTHSAAPSRRNSRWDIPKNSAQVTHGILLFMGRDKRVLHPGCLAKYAAAFYWNVTLLAHPA